MQNYKVTFGTTKTGRETTLIQKYPEQAVITVEGEPEKGKNRKMLFNKKAMESLNMPEGAIQNVVFAFIESEEDGSRKILIANTDGVDTEMFKTYSVTKNRGSHYLNSKERGKSISSKPLMEEISSFLELEKGVENEYSINPIDIGGPEGLELFELVNLKGASAANEVANPTPIDSGGYADSADSAVDVDVVDPLVVTPTGVEQGIPAANNAEEEEEENFEASSNSNPVQDRF